MNQFRLPRFPTRPPLFAVPYSSLLFGCLLAACSSSGSGGKTASGGKCYAPVATEPPAATALTAIELPESQVWVTANIPESATSEALAKKIPYTLASENKRDVGAPGYATYKVTRGQPTLVETKDGLEVQVPVNADISVCKKIGSACIQYGSCKPSFLAQFSVGTELDDNFQLAPPEGTIRATGRCVIGLDVTSQIEKIARGEVAKVEAQIKRQWPKFKPEVKRVWRQAEYPVPLSDTSCLQLNPDRIFYQKPSLKNGKKGQSLTAAVGVTGTVEPTADCKTKRKSSPLPKPKVRKKIPNKSKIWIPELVELKAAENALKESLSGTFGEGKLDVTAVRLLKDQVLLQLEVTGTVCGSFWMQGQLSHSPGAEALTLEKVELVGSSESPSELAELIGHIERTAYVKLASSAWFDDASLTLLKAGLRAAVPEEIEFEIKKLKAGSAQIKAAEDGLYVLHPITARLVVTDL